MARRLAVSEQEKPGELQLRARNGLYIRPPGRLDCRGSREALRVVELADEREATPQGDSGQEATSVSPDIEDSRAPDTVMAAERDELVEVDESRALQESVQSSLLGPTSTCWEELSKEEEIPDRLSVQPLVSGNTVIPGIGKLFGKTSA
ncbi:hypothetical protein MRX96_055115 [Rhipicephalus microplus]